MNRVALLLTAALVVTAPQAFAEKLPAGPLNNGVVYDYLRLEAE